MIYYDESGNVSEVSEQNVTEDEYTILLQFGIKINDLTQEDYEYYREKIYNSN